MSRPETMMTGEKQRPDGRDRYRQNGCRYFAPIPSDTVQCGLRVTHIGRSSMRLEVGLFRNDEPLTSARGRFVQVCCDRQTQKPIEMPAPVRAALEAIAEPK